MAAERPLLMSSRLQDPEQKIRFLEGQVLESRRRRGNSEGR